MFMKVYKMFISKIEYFIDIYLFILLRKFKISNNILNIEIYILFDYYYFILLRYVVKYSETLTESLTKTVRCMKFSQNEIRLIALLKRN